MTPTSRAAGCRPLNAMSDGRLAAQRGLGEFIYEDVAECEVVVGFGEVYDSWEGSGERQN